MIKKDGHEKKAPAGCLFCNGFDLAYLVSAGFTNALILRMVCPGSVLALMVTVLVWLFFLPFELNLTSISKACTRRNGLFGALWHGAAT